MVYGFFLQWKMEAKNFIHYSLTYMSDAKVKQTDNISKDNGIIF